MFECEHCKREFKSNAGLTRHRQSCSEVVEDTEPQTIKETTNEVQPTLSEKNERRIAKLRDAWKSTPDAEARHNIEQEIKALS